MRGTRCVVNLKKKEIDILLAAVITKRIISKYWFYARFFNAVLLLKNKFKLSFFFVYLFSYFSFSLFNFHRSVCIMYEYHQDRPTLDNSFSFINKKKLDTSIIINVEIFGQLLLVLTSNDFENISRVHTNRWD